VTGASSGIGAVVCRDLAARGARVAMVARTAETLTSARKELGDLARQCKTFPCDVGDWTAVQRMMKQATRALGAPSILVNNAGIAAVASFASMSPVEIERMVRTNVLGMAFCTRAVLPGMRAARRGVIVNVGSVAGLFAIPHMSLYAATKWAVTGFSESLNAELAGEGIHVGAVYPAVVDTPLVTREQARSGRSLPGAFTLRPNTVSRAVVNVIARERDLIVLPPALAPLAAARMSAGPLLRWAMRQTAPFFKPRPRAGGARRENA